MDKETEGCADDDRLRRDDEFVEAEPVELSSEVDPPESEKAVLRIAERANQPVVENTEEALQPAASNEAWLPGFTDKTKFHPGFQQVTPLDPNGPEEQLRRQTAVAGSVTSVFLGVWSIIFSFFTGLAVINAMLGIAFAVWGLFSNRSTLAVIGLILCCAGFLMTLIFAAR